MPFILPMMLQVGFGMSAFSSGLVTFAGGLGSFFNKMSTGPILRRFGYRNTFVVNAAIASAFIAACALFTASTSVAIMFAILAIGGYFRSLQFTALNSMVYADIPAAQMSAGTSLSSMVQQLTNGLGIALAAIAVHVFHVLRGGSDAPFVPADFHAALLVVAGLSLASIPFFWRMHPSAGAEVTGHRAAQRAAARIEGAPAE
jgi:MFS family permease